MIPLALMTEIPYEERGYAVEPSGIVHRRYAIHAAAYRKTTARGLLNLGRSDLAPCPACYPPPQPISRPRPAPKPPRAIEPPAPSETDE